MKILRLEKILIIVCVILQNYVHISNLHIVFTKDLNSSNIFSKE